MQFQSNLTFFWKKECFYESCSNYLYDFLMIPDFLMLNMQMIKVEM